MIWRSTITACIALVPFSALGEVVTRCGPSEGYAYFLNGPLVTADQSGWSKDGVSKGGIELVRNGREFDVIVTDTIGTKSMKGEGFIIVPVPQSSQSAITTLITFHQDTGVVEHYMFQLDPSGNGTLVWGSVKGGGALIQKSGVYRSACRAP